MLSHAQQLQVWLALVYAVSNPWKIAGFDFGKFIKLLIAFKT
jgi:hypothetical protein